ncbi:MAG: type II toxin-antitoxin system HicB family antitoxin [Hespellia sp.]|nr:type II toxin-antitoxin system HicB family antitoxin [Hespellia sp.]
MKKSKGFDIRFPDLPACCDSCDDMESGYAKAFKILGASLVEMESAGEEIPKPSMPQDISLQGGEFVVIIEFDMLEYKKRTRSKAVKKTLSIPCWLNEEATALGVNFSQILQDGLMRVISDKSSIR